MNLSNVGNKNVNIIL